MSTVRYNPSVIYPYCEMYCTYDVRFNLSCTRIVRCTIRTMLLASYPQLRRSWGSYTRVVSHSWGKSDSPVYQEELSQWLLGYETFYCVLFLGFCLWCRYFCPHYYLPYYNHWSGYCYLQTTLWQIYWYQLFTIHYYSAIWYMCHLVILVPYPYYLYV